MSDGLLVWMACWRSFGIGSTLHSVDLTDVAGGHHCPECLHDGLLVVLLPFGSSTSFSNAFRVFVPAGGTRGNGWAKSECLWSKHKQASVRILTLVTKDEGCRSTRNKKGRIDRVDHSYDGKYSATTLPSVGKDMITPDNGGYSEQGMMNACQILKVRVSREVQRSSLVPYLS